MRILFIGGTSFVGRHMASEAIERGHEVTLFHRGKTGAELFPDAEHVMGDRSSDLGRLSDRTWDAAIDVCGYVPREVRLSASILDGSVGTYLYVSSISAYRPAGDGGIRDDSPMLGAADLDDPTTEVVDGRTYGPLEALCEAEAFGGFPQRAIALRPTYVVGPYDPTDRFTYWVRRAAAGGDMLAPGPADMPVQVIDGRDLGAFAIDLVEAHRSGALNAIGPAEPITFGDMLNACVAATRSDARIIWVDPAFISSHGVDVEAKLPLWSPPEEWALMRVDTSTSIAAGLRLRPLQDTIRDTLAWDRDRGLPAITRSIDATREAELLVAWRAR